MNTGNNNYNIGDKVVDRTSQRTGKVIDLVEEFDTNGNKTYCSVKVCFDNDGQSDWIPSDSVSIMLLEENPSE